MSKKRPKNLREDIDLEDLFFNRANIERDVGGSDESFDVLLEKYLVLEDEAKGKAAGGSYHNQRARPFRWHPQDTLDLHGLTQEEAMARLEFFIQHSRHNGLRCIRVVTGKGLHSPAGPVLKDAAERRLMELKRKCEIKGFRWEKKRKTKSGAILVRL